VFTGPQHFTLPALGFFVLAGRRIVAGLSGSLKG
jgi:hypothetical protein